MENQETTQFLPLSEIHIDDNFNCRGTLAPTDVEDLAKDIRAHGLHQPVVVMPYDDAERTKTGFKYKLIAGFRRTYAHMILKMEKIECKIKPHMREVDARVINLSENLKRKELNILQEAQAIEALYLAGIPRDDVAKRIQMSSSWVQVRFALLQLPNEIQADASAGFLNQYELKKIASLPTVEEQYSVVKSIKEAKARGEKVDRFISRKPPKKTDKKTRTSGEINILLDHVMEQVPLGTEPPDDHLLLLAAGFAWATGTISDIQLTERIKAWRPDYLELTVGE